MKVMLDTNTCIAIIKRKPPQVLKRFNAYKVGEIGISWVTLAELEFGVAKSQHQVPAPATDRSANSARNSKAAWHQDS